MENVSLKPRGDEGLIRVTVLLDTPEWTAKLKLMNVNPIHV